MNKDDEHFPERTPNEESGAAVLFINIYSVVEACF